MCIQEKCEKISPLHFCFHNLYEIIWIWTQLWLVEEAWEKLLKSETMFATNLKNLLQNSYNILYF
jgi:hypothetical protein